MNFKEHRKDFNKRWNIITTESYEEAFKKFKQRILNIMESKDIDHIVTKESIFKFCQYYGIQEVYRGNRNVTVTDRLHSERNEKECYRLIEVIFSLSIRNLKTSDLWINFKKKIIKAIEISDVNVAVAENTEENIILYPKGEKKLDEELVDQVLSFLNAKSNKHFEEALKFYQDKKPIKSAESLRRALEEFLRYKLQNEKGLAQNITELSNNQKSDQTKAGQKDNSSFNNNDPQGDKLDKNLQSIQQRLKAQGVSPEIRNIITQTFSYMDKYFNEHSKHKDGNINEAENEFLIYQTGLLMRYIYKIPLKTQKNKADSKS